MKRRFFILFMMFGITFNQCACNRNNSNSISPEEENQENNETMKIKMTIGDRTLTATLLNNATTRAFVEKLPLTLHMLDLYSREMCYRFPEALPANEVSTRGYETGEIIYWTPGRSFVIMYAQNGERFAMQSMGRVDSGVEIFQQTGDVDVTFEKQM